jgi:protein arginine N-methyltransferase 1
MCAYSVSGYNSMIADKVRADAYVRAIRACVKPGAVVADIGTGSGMFALLACRLGAAKVYAIEPDDVLVLARQLAESNGCADRIEFIKGTSDTITLPSKADVIVSDLRGVLPLFGTHIPSVIDARERLLAPGGTLIPARDDIWAAIVQSEKAYGEHTEAGLEEMSELDLTPMRRMLINSWTKQRIESDQCLTEAKHLDTIDYRTIEQPTRKMKGEWRLEKTGTAHGACLWFDATLIDGVGFSNSPSATKAIYGQAFFPFVNPVSVEVGDCASVSLDAAFVAGDYLWRWETEIISQGGELKARFHQSTLENAILSRDRLHRRSNDFVPPSDSRHDQWRFVLERIDGSATLGAIAGELQGNFPESFPDWTKALTFVGDVVEAAH